MNNLREYIIEKFKINSNTIKQKYNYCPKDKNELQDLVYDLVYQRGNDADLNDIDTSNIDNMAGIFLNSNFNGDISKWNVSNVKNMLLMFNNSKFDGDLSRWDVSNVTNMVSMFAKSEFTGKNGDISNWDVRNVKSMLNMFKQCPLEKNPPKWFKKK